MPWIPLRDRLNHLPLVLAGPILRRTDPDAVTVWIAVKTACTVTLTIHITDPEEHTAIQAAILIGTRSTVRIGDHLHVVAVTATPINERCLQAGQIYAYDVTFTLQPAPSEKSISFQQALTSSAFPAVSVSYFAHGLPTFALPPDDLNQLQIAHGSCRKPHTNSLDALPILDDLIEQTATNPHNRLHQLFFTGDQIYGDDVADPFLFCLTDAASTLLGWEEPLPIAHSSTSGSTYLKPSELKPGHRSQIADIQGGLTAGLHDQPERAKSHLFSFGEYCIAYLLCWSHILWSDQLPAGEEYCDTAKHARVWNKEVKLLYSFAYTLHRVRRALANVPTYMIFDDHDISDDWYLNQAWCLRVLGKPLGRRTVQNGLLAYALFQAWGNTPDQFEVGRSGHHLLQATEQWSAAHGMHEPASETIARYLGLPSLDPLTGLPKMKLDDTVLVLDRDPEALTWHYTIRSARHEVIVLDTRTWRGYPTGTKAPTAPPMLLSPMAFEQQINQPMQQTDVLKQAGDSVIEATIVVAPTNLVSLQIIDWIQHWQLKQHKVFDNDIGDAWNIHKGALAQLLTTLFSQRQQVMVLSGDIHYGSAVRLDYWWHPADAVHPTTQESERAGVLAQLTSSAFSNAELKTCLVHTKLKSFLLPERNRHWLGWIDSNDIQEVKSGQVRLPDRDSPPDWSYRIEWMRRQPAQTPVWARDLFWLRVYHKHHTHWLTPLNRCISWLWRNRWVQDGDEVVGLNNLGVVTLVWSEQMMQRSVIQDLYWYAPWKPSSIVYSRYQVLLGINPFNSNCLT